MDGCGSDAMKIRNRKRGTFIMIISTKQVKDFRLGLWGTLCLGVVVLLLLGAAVYVVRADGVKLLPVADTYVASGRSTQNFASDRTFWVGYDQAGGYQIEQSLLKFDASAIQAGSKITSAKLGLYLSGTTKNDTSMTIKAYRIRSDWPAGITWDGLSSLAVDPEPVANAVVPATLGWYSWDLTAALQAWSDNRDTSNFSLMLRSDVTSGQHERGFWSKDCSTGDCGDPPGNRPYLEIVYALPTPTPTSTATHTPTATATLTHTPSPTLTPTPTPARIELGLIQVPSPADKPIQLEYTITYTNPTGLIAYSVFITNSVPLHTSFVSASGNGEPVPGVAPPVVEWSLGNLPRPGVAGGGVVTFTVELPSAAQSSGSLQMVSTPPIIFNSGAVARWQSPFNGTWYYSHSNALFWPKPLQLWLPLVLR